MRVRDFGRRISDDEYDQLIARLYDGSRLDEDFLQRKALDLAIDHRLGTGTPPSIREDLWLAKRRVQRSASRGALYFLLGRLFPVFMRKRLDQLADQTWREYAKVLTPEELQRFLDASSGARPGLPSAHT